ncbi:MAG TPA: sulfite exporter TauE/SafE family protein [Chloroflexota bacterium]|nr:sulfite exporter TauE/SafE family protein [Chloroflexota bacterium]
METNPLLIFVAASVALLIGLSKGGLGGTMGVLATPLMALVMPADQVIGLLLPVLMFADVFAVAFHWGYWNRWFVILLVPGGVLGVTIGTFFITNAPTETLQLLLGVIVLFFALYKIFEKQLLRWLTYRPHNWHGVAAGTVAGFSSALAHTGAPPVSIYLLLQKVTPRVFIATNALFFAILNWIKVPYYWYAGLFDFALLRQMAWMLPVAFVGVGMGRGMAGKISPQQYEQLILALLIISALLLIFT